MGGEPLIGVTRYQTVPGGMYIKDSAGLEIIRFSRGGNVGIGTIAPLGLLEVGTTTAAAPGLIVKGGTGAIGVGIGVNTPQTVFHIKGADPAAFVPNTMSTWDRMMIDMNSATAGDATGIRFITSTAVSHASPGIAGIAGPGGGGGGGEGGLVFMTAIGNVVYERMRIASSGNVGIGTTNPLAALSVVGEVIISDVISSGTGNGTALAIGSDGKLCTAGNCN